MSFRTFIIRPDFITFRGRRENTLFLVETCFQISDFWLTLRFVAPSPLQTVLNLFVEWPTLLIGQNASAIKLVLDLIFLAPFFSTSFEGLGQVRTFSTTSTARIFQTLAVAFCFCFTRCHVVTEQLRQEPTIKNEKCRNWRMLLLGYEPHHEL